MRKHGIVRCGNTVTMYGDDAARWMAQQWVAHCFDNRKCAKYINNQVEGAYKTALIDLAKKLGMITDAKKPGRVKALPKQIR